MCNEGGLWIAALAIDTTGHKVGVDDIVAEIEAWLNSVCVADLNDVQSMMIDDSRDGDDGVVDRDDRSVSDGNSVKGRGGMDKGYLKEEEGEADLHLDHLVEYVKVYVGTAIHR